jgi:hypothetical protein
LESSRGNVLRHSHREDANHDKVVAVLRQNKFTANVSAVRTGSVVVAEKKADTQATVPIVNLAKLLSVELQAVCLGCRGLSMLIRRITTRSSASICGRPREDRDFQGQ